MRSYILGRPRAVLKYSLLANFQGGAAFLQIFSIFVKFWTPLHLGGTPSGGPTPNIITGVKEVIKPSLLANFRKGPSIFESIMTVFAKFWTPLYMRGTLGIYPISIILRGAKDIVKYCTLANFRECTTNFSGFIPIFVKFWTPLYMGGTPGISPVPIILRGSKDFIRYSLLANFEKGTSNIAGFIPIFVEFWTPFIWGVPLKLIRSSPYSNLICLLS